MDIKDYNFEPENITPSPIPPVHERKKSEYLFGSKKIDVGLGVILGVVGPICLSENLLDPNIGLVIILTIFIVLALLVWGGCTRRALVFVRALIFTLILFFVTIIRICWFLFFEF